MGVLGGQEDMAREYWMTLPSIEDYIDVHCGTTIPKLPKSAIEDHLKSNEQEFRCKYESMYDQR